MSGRVDISNSTTPLKQAERMTDESHVLNDPETGSPKNQCQYKDHRKLAIMSIICGLSCFGIMSLIYSVKTRATNKKLDTNDPVSTSKAKEYSNKTFKWGVIAIISWVGLLILFPLSMGLISYLFTFIN
ncbi:transmembrane protein 265 [Electrophorus electricus]|uniref:transmembrane protein 265 n=1 Tax=Electrophorus electricus TaxID=8005 RepID=UPI000F0A2DC3|nr:transmembrane protein 265 [Electrophorus electricus]